MKLRVSGLLVIVALAVAGILSSAQGLAQNAYITNEGSKTVSVINTATDKVTANIPVGLYTYGVAVAPDGGNVYVTNGLSSDTNTVSVIDPAANTVVTTITVDAQPKGLAVTRSQACPLVHAGFPVSFCDDLIGTAGGFAVLYPVNWSESSESGSGVRP